MTTPLPFIVGCGRSGSTLLRAMLDAHPEMVVPNESYFIEQLMRRQDGYVSNGRFDLEAFFAELEADSRYRTWGVDIGAIRAGVSNARPADLAEAIHAVYGAVAESLGALRSADKTPHYSELVGDLAQLLPSAVFVHLVRDPRDVAASYRRASWGPRTLASAASMWVERTAAVAEAGALLGPSRYLEIRYEDLVADPEPQLRRLCDFIDLAFVPEMLQPEKSRAARTTAGRDGGAHANLLAGSTIQTHDWRSEMSASDAARIGAVADELAATFGYEPSPRLALTGRPRYFAERLVGLAESWSRRFRRTRLANRLRGGWRRLRGRSTLEQLGAAPG